MADTAASMVDDVVDVAEAAVDNDVDIVPAAAAVATYVSDSPTLACVDDCEVVVVVAASLALELQPSWVYPAMEPRQTPVVFPRLETKIILPLQTHMMKQPSPPLSRSG